MTDRPTSSTSGIDANDRTQRDRWAAYRRGEHPEYRFSIEAACPDCHAPAPPYEHVIEHEPCGCIRPFDEFADANGCPNCGGVDDATVIARLYACPACGSSFDTPAYHLTACEAVLSTPTRASATAFEWGPPLEPGEPSESDSGATAGPTESVSVAGNGGGGEP